MEATAKALTELALQQHPTDLLGLNWPLVSWVLDLGFRVYGGNEEMEKKMKTIMEIWAWGLEWKRKWKLL